MMQEAFKKCDIPLENPLINTDTVKLFEGLGASSSTSQFCDCECDCDETCNDSKDLCALKPPYYLYGTDYGESSYVDWHSKTSSEVYEWGNQDEDCGGKLVEWKRNKQEVKDIVYDKQLYLDKKKPCTSDRDADKDDLRSYCPTDYNSNTNPKFVYYDQVWPAANVYRRICKLSAGAHPVQASPRNRVNDELIMLAKNMIYTWTGAFDEGRAKGLYHLYKCLPKSQRKALQMSDDGVGVSMKDIESATDVTTGYGKKIKKCMLPEVQCYEREDRAGEEFVDVPGRTAFDSGAPHCDTDDECDKYNKDKDYKFCKTTEAEYAWCNTKGHNKCQCFRSRDTSNDICIKKKSGEKKYIQIV
jgi:hypothetical protein